METIEVERLANKTNMPVIKLSYRTFPGVLVQGDTLASLYALAALLHQLHTTEHPQHPDPANDEGYYDSKQLVNMLGDIIREYETALNEHGFRLPYDQVMTQTAWRR